MGAHRALVNPHASADRSDVDVAHSELTAEHCLGQAPYQRIKALASCTHRSEHWGLGRANHV